MLTKKLKMSFDPNVVKHLGLSMYSTLPASLSELIANAWDADATEVEVIHDEINKTITVVDNGCGMSFNEIQENYLRIGRDRRKSESSDITPKGRLVMGRKGLGKLAGFGISSTVQIETVKDGEYTNFIIDFNKMINNNVTTSLDKDYEPEILDYSEKVDKPNGTKVVLSNLKLTQLRWDYVKKAVARRFLTFKQGLSIKINNDVLTEENYDVKNICEHVWFVGKPEETNNIDSGELIVKRENGENNSVNVSGWIGTTSKPVPREIKNGIAIYARHKLVQEPCFANIVPQGTQTIAFSYMIGNIEAEFLDGDEDKIGTNRTSIVWTSEEGEALEEWLQKIIKTVSNKWYELREEKNIKRITGDTGDLDAFVAHLGSERQKEEAKKLIRQIAKTASSDEIAQDLAGYVVESTEYRSFVEFINALDGKPAITAVKFVELMKDWQIIESRELLRILSGRVYAIKVLVDMMNNNSLEKSIHNFLENNAWIIDPTLTVAYSEKSFTTLLKQEFPDSDSKGDSKRFDLVCLGINGDYYIVELKRPNVVIGFDELNQVEKYISIVKSMIKGQTKNQDKKVKGLLFYGKSQADVDLTERRSIECVSYFQLIDKALKIHKEFIDNLEKNSNFRPILNKISPLYKTLNINTDIIKD